MEKFNKLITYLMAIEGKAKDIHYNCPGADFYGKHLFADRIADGLDDFIDQIKETCILGKGYKPLFANEYLRQASALINGSIEFATLYNLIVDCLQLIETFNGVSRGDSKLLDDIANKLQNDKGLLQIMFGE